MAIRNPSEKDITDPKLLERLVREITDEISATGKRIDGLSSRIAESEKSKASTDSAVSQLRSALQRVVTKTRNIFTSTSDPNGAITGSVGDLCINASGGAGTTLYVKESGSNSSSGWVGK